MRTPRIKEDGAGYYHVISRVVDRRMVFDRDEKERFRTTMRAVEAFSGCEVLTYACLDNHFHILLLVPERRPVTDEELVSHLRYLYERQEVKTIAAYLKELRRDGDHSAAEQLKSRYTYRMYDLSEFVKTLKQRITQSYNRRHGRKGTLWEERFKSVLIGNSEMALSAVAAYIDLNAMRAGIVNDPKEYRFCGYGEAVGGSSQARRGLGKVIRSLNAASGWTAVAREYRKLLYVTGEVRGLSQAGQASKPGFQPQRVAQVIEAGGALPLNQLLRCRVRYFSDGAILGSRAFVEDVFSRHRDRFSPNRGRIAHGMSGGNWADLCTFRRLRLSPIVVPTLPAG
jgi:REP element-mobilizing transposase RayT